MFSLLASLALYSSAQAQEVPAASPPSASAEAQPGKKICRKVQNTSSRMAKRECKTANEWDKDRGKSEGELRNIGGR